MSSRRSLQAGASRRGQQQQQQQRQRRAQQHGTHTVARGSPYAQPVTRRVAASGGSGGGGGQRSMAARKAVEAVCGALAYAGVVGVTPELFRRAKLNRPDVV